MKPNEDIRLLARNAVLDEISYRMDKLWRIFSWTSTVLIAIIGGTIALRKDQVDLALGHQSVVAGAVVVLAVYAMIWLRQNLRLEGRARDALAAHDLEVGIASYNEAIGGALPRPDIGIVVGYNLTVLLLALGAIAAVFIPL